MTTATKFTAFVVLVMAFSYTGFCQEDHTTYIITPFFGGLDKQLEVLETAHRLANLIEQSGLRGSAESSKDPWTCCAGKHEKQMVHCAAVYAKIDIGPDKTKIIRVYVVEGKDDGEVPASPHISCDPDVAVDDCYGTNLRAMARAVKSHDDLCHTGKKCVSRDHRFITE